MPVVMLVIGLCFIFMGFAGHPALLVTGVFYEWIGIRGLRAVLSGRADASQDSATEQSSA